LKILLISSNRERHPWPVLPIGLCYVASSLEKSGFDVQFLDMQWLERSDGMIEKSIAVFKPDLVGVSIRNIDNVDQQAPFFYLEDVLKNVIEPVKLATDAPLVIGGSAVSVMPTRIMEYLDVEYAISGEGEDGMVQFARFCERGTDVSQVSGLLQRKGNAIIRNPIKRIEKLDELTPPEIYRWIDWGRYRLNYTPFPVQTKRGCALTCTYCVYNSVEGRRYRLRDPAGVVDEIEDIVRICNPQVIEFTDSTFNIPIEHAMAVCREIIKRKLKVSFNTMGINPSNVTEEFAALMKEANFMEVSCTPETGSSRMLKSLGKNFTLEDVRRTAENLKKVDLPVVWYFLFGGPGENEDTIRETFSFIETNIRKKDLVFITSGIRILPDSPLYDFAIEEGCIQEDTDILKPCWYHPEGITSENMLFLINREVITHCNYINLMDNTDESLLARVLKRMYSLFRLNEPIWTNIHRRYIINRLTGYNFYRLWALNRKHRQCETNLQRRM
jgi:anaerobic magnesium-protoporphyrin IX monomethyl ester cyclase